ncbi:RES family NAD+ phosphorylase [Mucilaginibacter arboris]|uniref:RES domain-containing protein n=1 Tax=Mucilaginibacter arboris TaxID=2682090 RepID=A0A7K1T1T0_9SPHI|nr:RES family NAD+ phosphorylase [Mucilaginibacter arboris]MVN23478.1 RES domain-containing protein [Mucilaginibacter arboris]
MKLFRLAKSKYSRDLSGRGAEKAGGRWNSKGTPILYTAQSIALATTEIAVHVPLGILPKGYVAITYELPEQVTILELKPDEWPADFKSIPHSHSTQVIGDEFIAHKKALILKVPSVVVQGDFNYLINPNHPDLEKVVIIAAEPYEFDERLFFR